MLFSSTEKKTNVENEQETSRKNAVEICSNILEKKKCPIHAWDRCCIRNIDVDTIWLRSYYTERVDLSLKWDTYGGGKLSGSACQGLLNYPEPVSTLVKELPSFLSQDYANFYPNEQVALFYLASDDAY